MSDIEQNHPASIPSTQKAVSFSWRRLKALCIKESKQIIRDPSSALIAVVIPLILLFIFGYGINLDSSKLRLGILMEQQSEDARKLVHAFIGSPYIDATISNDRQLLINKIQASEIRGIIVIPVNFDARLARVGDHAPIQVITDGSEPNIANFVQSYAKGIWQIWLQQQSQDRGVSTTPLIDMQIRYWFNPAAISQHFLIPGAISIIMTVVGAILTSLVVAREWERGTMEALLSTQVTRTELLLSKLLPYQVLGSFVMVLCMVFAVFIMGIPYHGSLWILALISSLYLATALGMGLFISTVTRNQFNAAMISLNTAFLPAIMLSGFVFEINSMPALIQVFTYIVPARYFVSSLQTLFLVGNVGTVLITNLLFLIASAIVFISLTAWKTRRHLD
ncbi:ABC transporter permease [Xenorhabdus siamensis]|uniref:ABC transporter permease n=1 Tax=Xenorhabdus siamensis TaxID=3136254 RepID=UPI0030F455BC